MAELRLIACRFSADEPIDLTEFQVLLDRVGPSLSDVELESVLLTVGVAVVTELAIDRIEDDSDP